MFYTQAMKTVKTDLGNEGRQDIIKRIRAYRGGKNIHLSFNITIHPFNFDSEQDILERYFVFSSISGLVTYLYSRIVAKSSMKLFQANC